MELAKFLRDMNLGGIKHVAFDRCPRCETFTVIETTGLITAQDVINMWVIWKATEFARMDSYIDHARSFVRSGQLVDARELAFETVAHVNLEDPRPHLLLGQLAVVLRDRRLLREARKFLEYFKLETWLRELDRTAETGSPDFEFEGSTRISLKTPPDHAPRPNACL